jgi:hypothetical protein
MSIQRQQKIESFPTEIRDYNIERCARMASDFFNVGDFVETTGGTPAGTIAYAAEYSTPNQTAGVVTLEIPSNAAQATRCSIRDHGTASTLALGTCEFDFLCRARIAAGTPNAGDAYIRIGFFDSILARQNAGQSANGLVFERGPAETTWRVAVWGNWDGSTGTRVRIDTGVPVSQWSTFGIWVSQDGQKAVFTVDDVVKHTVTGLPFTASIRVGLDAHATGTVTTAYQLKSDYLQFRYFTRRA